jgi:phosphate transport system permease protein
MMHDRDDFHPAIKSRRRKGEIMALVFLLSTVFGVLCLITLLVSILDQTAGYVLMEYATAEEDVLPLDDNGNPVKIESLDTAALAQIIGEYVTPRRLAALNIDSSLETRPKKELIDLLVAEVLEPEVVRTWPFFESVLKRNDIFKYCQENSPEGSLVFRFWINPEFLTSSQSSNALYAGVRSAIIGSFLTILLTLLIAFPVGLGAAIYLEEYAADNRVNRIIKTNIYNLAGVPSIIYGMLGLGIFVRFLGPLTSGSLFGLSGNGDAADGRTILSAGLTLALLILPTIIINAQEALRAVPRSLRESGYAVGATKWQVIFHHILPASMDRILTGTVLAVSRGIGETAPLILVGASTFLTKDPTGIFSRFTTLPIQIYQWTSRPQAEFRNIAAAGIVILLVLLLSLNATAIVMRNKFRAQNKG